MARTRYTSAQQSIPLRDLPAAALRAVWREGYTAATLRADVMAGLVVGIVALPLAMALAIAVGVPPQQGLYTAIVAGALVAILGGSRTQVSGPTAAFVVILAPIYARFGMSGLLISGLLAGLILIGMGLFRMGKLIEFIPHPVTTGFTAGIATVIAVLQLKDFFGLQPTHTPAHFAERVVSMVEVAGTASPWEFVVGIFTLALLLLIPRLTKRVPAPLLALSAAAILAALLSRFAGAQIATIASRFHAEIGGRMVDGIPQLPPLPLLPWLAPGPGGEPLGLGTLRALLPSAFAIAMLGAIESLLSAVVADGMARTKHDPDAELLALGVGNVVTPFFGGIPATGAIARTATAIRSGARTPISAVVHALTVFIAVIALAPLLGYLPMSALAALLILVAWNMSEAKHFIHTIKVAPRSDVAVLLTCFGLTVFTDMVIGVGVGLGLAALLVMRRMVEVSEAHMVDGAETALPGPVPEGVVVYRVYGPLFFGAAQKAMGALGSIGNTARVVIFWLEHVPAMDATGLVALESAIERLRGSGIVAVLHGLRPQPRGVVERSGLLSKPGVVTTSNPAEALRLAGELAASAADALAPIPAHATAGEVMSRDVASISPTASLREVVELMLLKLRRAVPVVEGGRVVGIITNGDLVQRGGLGGRLQLLRGLAWRDVHAQLEGLAGAAKCAADVMSPDPVTVLASTPLRKVAGIMAKRKLKRLPVVDDAGALIGMVSRVDLLRSAVGKERPGEAPIAVAAPAGAQVARVMRTDIPSVLPTASLPEVLEAVISTRLNKALVVDRDHHVVGLVSDAELMERMTPALRPGLLRAIMQRLPFTHPDERHGAAAQPHLRGKTAADVMLTGVPHVAADAPLTVAISTMLDSDGKILAVVDSAGRLMGIVDRADLLRGVASASASKEEDPA
jgi:SulP family sulfate permease